jgi:hypothetical protein
MSGCPRLTEKQAASSSGCSSRVTDNSMGGL